MVGARQAYPSNPSQKRPDAKNFVVTAASAAEARQKAEAMCGQVDGCFKDWNSVELTGSTTDFCFESAIGPIGRKVESAFGQLTRGGDYLAA